MANHHQHNLFSDAIIIFKKEFKNVFKDKRAIFSNYVLPVVLMPLLFLGLGYVSQQQVTSAQERVYQIHFVGSVPQEFPQMLSQYLLFQESDQGYDRNSITLEFSRDTRGRINVILYSDSTSTPQSLAAGRIETALETYNQQLAARTLGQVGLSPEDLSHVIISRADTAPEEAQGSSFLSAMLPYLLLIYLFAGAMAMGMNITAGEKERGGLSLLLVNQVSRNSIALGKVFFLIVSAMLSSISSAGGIILAVQLNPSMFGGATEGAGSALLQPGGMVSLLLTVLSAGGVSAALIVLLGSLSRNMKEASGYISPVYILVIFLGVLTMNLDATDNLMYFLIPLGNLVFMLKGIITSQFTLMQLAITLGINTVTVAVLVYAIAKLYNSEKILSSGA